MAARPQSDLPSRPTPIDAGAAAHLQYIRNTIAASRTFTTVPGRGCIAMGAIALAAAALESVPAAAAHWLAIWCAAALAAGAVALVTMQSKARAQGTSLTDSMARRFLLTLAPAFAAGAILTVALNGDVGRNGIAGIWLLLYGAGVAASGVFSIPAGLLSGCAFMLAGTVALMLPAAAAPAMLAAGFGGVHIALGIVVVTRHGG